MGAEQRWLLALILVALVAGIIGLFVNRSTDSPFNELSADWRVDITAWVLALAVGVPLLLWNGPIAQRFVLIGVTASSLFFGFLQASAVVRYGTDWYDEGPWILVNLLQIGVPLRRLLPRTPAAAPSQYRRHRRSGSGWSRSQPCAPC